MKAIATKNQKINIAITIRKLNRKDKHKMNGNKMIKIVVVIIKFQKIFHG